MEPQNDQSNRDGFSMTTHCLTLLALRGSGCPLPLSLGWLGWLWPVQYNQINTMKLLAQPLRGLTASALVLWSFELHVKCVTPLMEKSWDYTKREKGSTEASVSFVLTEMPGIWMKLTETVQTRWAVRRLSPSLLRHAVWSRNITQPWSCREWS